jgi:hypothetical protein
MITTNKITIIINFIMMIIVMMLIIIMILTNNSNNHSGNGQSRFSLPWNLDSQTENIIQPGGVQRSREAGLYVQYCEGIADQCGLQARNGIDLGADLEAWNGWRTYRHSRQGLSARYALNWYNPLSMAMAQKLLTLNNWKVACRHIITIWM